MNCRNRRQNPRFRRFRMSCSRSNHRRNLLIRRRSDPSSSTCWIQHDRWGIPKRIGEQPCRVMPTRRPSCSSWANYRHPLVKWEKGEDRAFALLLHRPSLLTLGRRRLKCRRVTTPSPQLDLTRLTTSGRTDQRTGSNFEMPWCVGRLIVSTFLSVCSALKLNSVGVGEGFTSSTFNVVRWLMTTTTKQIGIKRQEKLKFVSKIQEERSIRVIDEIWCCSSNHRTYLYIQGGWTGSWRLDRQGYSLIRVLRLVCCPSLNQKVKTRSLITVSVTSSFIAHYTPISQGRRCNGVAARRDESFLIISTLNRVVPLFFPKTASPFRLVNVAANSPFLFFFFLPLTSSMSFASLHHWNPPDVPFSFIILQLFP